MQHLPGILKLDLYLPPVLLLGFIKYLCIANLIAFHLFQSAAVKISHHYAERQSPR